MPSILARFVENCVVLCAFAVDIMSTALFVVAYVVFCVCEYDVATQKWIQEFLTMISLLMMSILATNDIVLKGDINELEDKINKLKSRGTRYDGI